MKMGFLKLTKGKIIATSILVIILLYSLLTCYITNASSCLSLNFIAPLLIIISFPLFIIIEPIGDQVGTSLTLLSALILSVIYSYIIVSVITAIINKLKK